MEICKSLSSLRTFQGQISRSGRPLALIPTMGALHAGHLSLVAAAKRDGHATLVSLFINPAQFAAHEDLATYPQTFDADVAALKTAGVEGLFAPSRMLMYPQGDITRVNVGDLGKIWEGGERPHFFTGVATVVAKLLILVRAQAAYFGEKDYQQVQVIRQMAADLLIETEIVACPTIRAKNGLALSSRNSYLNAAQQETASQLYTVLKQVRTQILNGDAIGPSLNQAETALLSLGFSRVSYLAYVDARTLTPLDRPLPKGSGRLIAAAHLAGVRLIDNLAV